MAVLVTGGAGYIGSHAVAQLVAAGEKVIVLDNLSTGFREAVHSSAQLIEGRVHDIALLNRIFTEHQIDCVLHFAASLIVPESVEKPLDYYENNLGGMLALLKAMTQSKVSRIIFSSTAATYGMPDTVAPIAEKTLTSPINPYGSSKLAAETLLKEAAQAHGLHYAILRYFNVAGAAMDGSNGQRSRNATHLVKVAVEAANGKRSGMSIFGTDYSTADGTCVRDYIHVEDLASAHLAALAYLRSGKPSLTVNCGYGRGASVREVIAMVKQVSGVDFAVTEADRREGDPPFLVADGSLIQQQFGWKPKYNDLKVIVSSAYDWERKLPAS